MINWSVLHADTVVQDNVSVAMPKRSRQVLLRLLVDANRSVSTEQLADALWDDDSLPVSVANSISRFVTDLRRSLGDHGTRIEKTPLGYKVNVEPNELDLDLIGAATERAHASELRALIDRAGLEENHHFDDLRGLEGVQRGHAERRIALIERCVECMIDDQQFSDVSPLVERALGQHRYHERFWQLLIQNHTAAARPGDAQHAYERARAAMAEIGAEPSSRLGPPAMDGTQKPAAIHNEPRPAAPERLDPPSPLIGRIEELRELHHLVRTHRCVTLVGLGGSGKTRLAAAVVESLDDGTTVHHVSLRATDHPEMVVALTAQAVGLPSAGDIDSIGFAQAIAHQHFVLVLDNAEHLSAACTELIAALIEHTPHVRILATSRIALASPHETVFTLGVLNLRSAPLTTPDGLTAPAGMAHPSDAAAMFLDRARTRIDDDPADLADDVVASVERICARLHGLPLAIEVAAAQLSFMSLDVLESRIGQAFDATNPVTEPAVVAVTSVLDWAWARLTPSQQLLLARLSVFPSGWTVESAHTVQAGGGSLSTDLDRLDAASLVQLAGGAGPSGRYSMLEPVRDYATDRLAEFGETEIFERRLADWALELTGRWSFPEHHLWSAPNDELEPESGNLIAAMGILDAAGQHEELVTLVVASSGMMVNRGLASTVIRWLRPHVNNELLAPALRCSVCVALGTAFHATGELDQLSELGDKGVDLAAGMALDWVPVLSGYCAVWSLVAPTEHTTEDFITIAFDAAEASTSRRLNLGVASLYSAHVQFISRDYESALALFREAEEFIARPGRGLVVTELGITLSLYMLGRHDDARASIAGWRSRSDTDHWHYIIEVVRAIVIGGTGDAASAAVATSELSATVRQLPEAGAWGRAGIIQTAYAMLADFRGEPELANELFTSAVNRDILLLTVAIAHVMASRGVTGDEAFLEVGLEFWTRVVPPDSVAATATSTPQLMRWWVSGET